MVQSGVYAAETLCGSFGCMHCINLFTVGTLGQLLFMLADVHFVIDDVIWIWYYDRQGCIQSEGINFLDDLPSFLVLLFALQRLKLEQWGLNPSCDERVGRAHAGTLPLDTEGRAKKLDLLSLSVGGKEFQLTQRVYHSTLGIIGRGTVTVAAQLTCGPLGQRYAVKLSWPEETRPNEAHVLQAAMDSARGDTDITNHIPTVFAMQDFPYRTGTVRKALGIPASGQGHPDSRVLRVIVFPYLKPITASTQKFFHSWLECVRCKCCQTSLTRTRFRRSR